MNKEQKKNYISEMTTRFENSKAVLVTHYQGLTMVQLDDLRAKMREHGIIFKITKNRITKLALEKTKCKDLSSLFTGPTAVAFSEDAIVSARILSKFANFDKILADTIASSLKATAVGPVNRLERSLHLVFSSASLVILFFVILKIIPCSLILALKSSN